MAKKAIAVVGAVVGLVTLSGADFRLCGPNIMSCIMHRSGSIDMYNRRWP